MSYSYERVERRRGTVGGRSYLGYWVPLVLTASIATVGVAAWIWSERQDGEEDYDRDAPRDERRDDLGRRDGAPPPGHNDLGPGETSFASGAAAAARGAQEATSSVVARMSGAIRRTPSPQQMLDGASRTVAAGVAAAGAVVGGALSSIREEGKDDYVDHSRWSEEAEARRAAGAAGSGPADTRRATASTGARAASGGQYQVSTKRKTVAIVVSAESDAAAPGHDDDAHHGEASILSHLPAHIDHGSTRLFVLIYAPDLKQSQLPASASPNATGSLTSSFSHIGHDDARTPGDEGERPLSSVEPTPAYSPDSATPSGPPAFNSLYAEAQALVEKDSMILPFTTASGHVHLLRHLAPDVVYIQESLSGTNGDVVAHISGWVGEIVVVVGAEGGHGGLVDSEEDEMVQAEAKGDLWWQKEERVGLGRGVEVVEGMRVGEHWGRKLGGLE